jgi:hypothetical protein
VYGYGTTIEVIPAAQLKQKSRLPGKRLFSYSTTTNTHVNKLKSTLSSATKRPSRLSNTV